MDLLIIVTVAWSSERARALIEPMRTMPGALLPVLHALQSEFGWIDPTAVPVVADVLNLSRAEVHGVITFYRDFRTEPPGRAVVRICRAEACQAWGAEELAAHAREHLGLELGATSDDGAVCLEQVFCFGNCARGPSVEVAGRLHAGVDAAVFDTLVAEIAPTAATEPVANEPDTADLVVYVPGDAAARAAGADDVARALRAGAGERGLTVHVIRNGSRGLLWLEPLVELATPDGRLAFGPISTDDVSGLLDVLVAAPERHERFLGPTDAIPWLARQQRITFARVGIVDPRSPHDYEAAGGMTGLRVALGLEPDAVVDAVTESGLRGRGGAGFPAGIKWKTVLDAPGATKYVCANADEGDGGSFADRMLMEGDPFALLEGMTICAAAVGARTGYVYLRSEYPDAARVLGQAIDLARARGWLGAGILGSALDFDVELRLGAGSYICGEETAMLESLEGKRGVVRAKPPLPAIEGLFGCPTVVNNVLTLATVPAILAAGPSPYEQLGVARSRGTQVFQLAGNVARGGIVEVPFGVTLGELVDEFGGGTATGRPVRAAQVGGPLGAFHPRAELDLSMDYESLAAADGLLGHGGVVVFDDTVDLGRQARFAMEFCAEESCGKCTPCRIGAVRGVEVIDRVLADDDRAANLALLEDLCEVMHDASLCAMGGLTPVPVRSALRHFRDDFERPAQG